MATNLPRRPADSEGENFPHSATNTRISIIPRPGPGRAESVDTAPRPPPLRPPPPRPRPGRHRCWPSVRPHGRPQISAGVCYRPQDYFTSAQFGACRWLAAAMATSRRRLGLCSRPPFRGVTQPWRDTPPPPPAHGDTLPELSCPTPRCGTGVQVGYLTGGACPSRCHQGSHGSRSKGGTSRGLWRGQIVLLEGAKSFREANSFNTAHESNVKTGRCFRGQSAFGGAVAPPLGSAPVCIAASGD